MAAEEVGWTNQFHCEIEEFPRKILKYHFPKTVSYDDIRATDFSIWRGRIDVLSGGFPCQPYSVAGKQRGKEDERHLWPEMLRAIREIQPRWIVGENVYGLLNWSGGLVFEEVCAEMEAEGYQVQPFILPAASVNAPHKRDRIWFIGYSEHYGPSTTEGGRSDGENSERSEKRENSTLESQGADEPEKLGSLSITNSDSHVYEGGLDTRRTRDKSEGGEGAGERKGRGQNGERLRPESRTGGQDVADSKTVGLQGSEQADRSEGAQSDDQFINGRSREWDNAWSQFPTVSPVHSRNDGISYGLDGITFSKWRSESIKGFGNAIVPQVAIEIFQTINDYEKTQRF